MAALSCSLGLSWAPGWPCSPQVAALALGGSGTVLASAQAGPRSLGRLWDFPTGACLCLFKTYLQSLLCLRWVAVRAGVCSALQHSSFPCCSCLTNQARVTAACVCHRTRCQLCAELIPQVLLSPHPHYLSPFMPWEDEPRVQGAVFHQVSLLAAFPTVELFCVVSGGTCTAKR